MADLSQTATLVIGYGDRSHGVLGGTVAAGMPVRKQTNGTFIAATDASAVGAAVEGIATSGGATGQDFTYQKGGNINLGATLVVGMPYMLSTSGGIKPASDHATGEFSTNLGIATTAAILKMGVCVGGVAAASDIT